MTKAANNSVPAYTTINAVCTKTKINDGDSLRCIADLDASTLWDSSNESISHESNEEHSAASTLCDSSLDSNKDRSVASTIDYDNAVHPFDTLAKLCYVLYGEIRVVVIFWVTRAISRDKENSLKYFKNWNDIIITMGMY
jgi:hypothetical protein